MVVFGQGLASSAVRIEAEADRLVASAGTEPALPKRRSLYRQGILSARAAKAMSLGRPARTVAKSPKVLQSQAIPPKAAPTATTLEPAPPAVPAYRVQLPDWWMVAGGPGRDLLTGNGEAELMFGFDGNDSLQAKGGDDRIYGGSGDDLLAGGSGDDHLLGEAGQDDLFGGSGSDRLDGGAGDDRIRGGAGDDWILLSAGSDDVDGGAGKDTFDARERDRADAATDDLSSAANVPSRGAVTLRYQVDFVETLTSNKQKVIFVPQANLRLSFQEQAQGLGDRGAAVAQSRTSKSHGKGRRPTAKKNASLLQSPEAHKLRSVEWVMAPWGEANEIDFSFRKIKSAFSPYGDVTAPSIELDLAQETLRYTKPAGGDGSVDALFTVTVQGFQHARGSFGDDVIRGDLHSNRLFGGYGKDVLIGGAGNDLLISNEGDVLTGGEGKDCFKLNAAWYRQIKRGKSTPQDIKAVRIEDFDGAAGDRIHLENEVRTSVSLSAEKSLQYAPFASLTDGLVSPEQFLVLGQGELSDETKLIYDGGSGELFYRSSEALGGLQRRHLVAVLAGAPSLQAENLLVV